MAKRLYPKELLQRPLPTDLTSIPRLFHQSWINETMPTKFEEWSNSCRKAHPDWEWILWTDEDNLKLVEKYAPWFNTTYELLRSEIFRADAARNIYMHIFGGVYADLDTECLLPYETMFDKYNMSTVPYGKSQRPSSARKAESRQETPDEDTDISVIGERKAFVGRMGMDDNAINSIPNAWMASTAGHPFWLLPLQAAEDLATLNGMEPERMTGPIALRDQTINYIENFDGGEGDGGIKLDERYAKSGWRHLYRPSHLKGVARIPQSLVILPHYEVFPFSWQRDGDPFKDFCTASSQNFDAERCKALTGSDHWGSHSITYWSHSWGMNGEGHWDDHMAAISKSNRKEAEKGGGEGKGDGEKKGVIDAAEAEKKAEEWREQLEKEEMKAMKEKLCENEGKEDEKDLPLECFSKSLPD